MKYIPYGRQYIDDEDIQAVIEVLKSDFLTTGPKIEEFEKTFAAYVGAKYAVAISNGTAALHIACLAAGIKEGDEVITTPITFAASANCILYCGGTPVFADIDPITYNIDIEDIKRKLTPRTRAIIPVHFTGQPCDMDKIHEIAKEYNLIVIEDAAHAVGAEYNGKKVGNLSDLTTFSFHPVKHITTGEGGMVTTNNKEFYQKLLLFRTHGITRGSELLFKDEGGWYYEQQELGFNYRITDFQAALGTSQLKKIDGFLRRRKEIVERYNKAFEKEKAITVPAQLEGTDSSWHLYVIKVAPSIRKKVFDKLRESNIGVNVHYVPVYKHPYYQKNGYANVTCKESEALYESMISIPLYFGLSEEEQDYVIDKTLEIIKIFSK